MTMWKLDVSCWFWYGHVTLLFVNSNWSKFVVALISSLSKKLIAKRGLMQLANDISGGALTLYYTWVQLLH